MRNEAVTHKNIGGRKVEGVDRPNTTYKLVIV